jgi:hypothetical protein
VRFQFIEDHRDECPVTRMCKALNVSPSGFYAWRSRPVSAREMANRELVKKIEAVYYDSYETYGSPRVYHELKSQGVACSENRVARLMRLRGLRAKQVRRYKTTTKRNKNHPVAPNLLKRDFHAERPDHKWLTDITYIPTREGWLYLAVILDLYNRGIVGWAMSERMTSALTIRALKMAIRERRPGAGLIHHSDRAPVRAFVFSGVDTSFPAEKGTAQRLTLKSKDQWEQSVTHEKGKREFHQTNGFLRASSTWRKLDCLNPRIERDLWYRVGKMVTPTLSWIRRRLVRVPYSRPRDASRYIGGNDLNGAPKSSASGRMAKRGLPESGRTWCYGSLGA